MKVKVTYSDGRSLTLNAKPFSDILLFDLRKYNKPIDNVTSICIVAESSKAKRGNDHEIVSFKQGRVASV